MNLHTSWSFIENNFILNSLYSMDEQISHLSYTQKSCGKIPNVDMVNALSKPFQ